MSFDLSAIQGVKCKAEYNSFHKKEPCWGVGKGGGETGLITATPVIRLTKQIF